MEIAGRKITPLVEQISIAIKRKIVNKGFSVGDKLPTVAAWVSELSVSDKTIQKVFALLENDGILTSHVGKGTFLKQIPYCPELTEQTQNKKVFSNTIAVLDGQSEVDLSCEHTESWTTRIVHGMRVEAAANDIDLLLLNDSLDVNSLLRRLEKIKNKIDGIITFPFTDNHTLFEMFDKCGIPAITINKPCADAQNNYVAADYFEGSKIVGALFAEINCKTVWFITTQMTGIYSKEQRYMGLVDGLKLSGSDCVVKVVVVETATDADAYKAVLKLLQSENKPDGIYCSGDYLAMGAIEALKEKGIAVGRDGGASVIGSSGFELSAHITPALTVVQIPMVEMGRNAIRKMLEMRGFPNRRIEGQTLPARLILRDSTPSLLKEDCWLESIQQARPRACI